VSPNVLPNVCILANLRRKAGQPAKGMHGWLPILNRSYLKKVFWPNLGVGSSLQVLNILEYACGLKLGAALILNQNPFFEMASRGGENA